MAQNNDLTQSLESAQVHRGLEINSLGDDIILILILGYVCYSTITSGSSQHSAGVLFGLYAAQSRHHVGALVGLARPNKAPIPQTETWNTINKWIFGSFYKVKPPPHKRKAPLLQTLTGDGSDAAASERSHLDAV